MIQAKNGGCFSKRPHVTTMSTLFLHWHLTTVLNTRGRKHICVVCAWTCETRPYNYATRVTSDLGDGCAGAGREAEKSFVSSGRGRVGKCDLACSVFLVVSPRISRSEQRNKRFHYLDKWRVWCEVDSDFPRDRRDNTRVPPGAVRAACRRNSRRLTISKKPNQPGFRDALSITYHKKPINLAYTLWWLRK